MVLKKSGFTNIIAEVIFDAGLVSVIAAVDIKTFAHASLRIKDAIEYVFLGFLDLKNWLQIAIRADIEAFFKNSFCTNPVIH